MFHFKTRKDASSNQTKFKLESNVPRFILDPSAIWRGSSCKVPVTRESRPSIHDTYVLPPRDPERIRRVAAPIERDTYVATTAEQSSRPSTEETSTNTKELKRWNDPADRIVNA